MITSSLNDEFNTQAIRAFRELFTRARNRDELQFAFALSPEFRGAQDPGWNTAHEAQRAFGDYLEFIRGERRPSIRARVALGFYSHLSEASGFYEIPKNLLRICDGEKYGVWPFARLVTNHKLTGQKIAPNSNKIICDLVGHAEESNQHNLAEVFRDAFDGDLRNAYAHADYVIWNDGIRLPKRNGGAHRVVSWEEFGLRLDRAISFFQSLNQVLDENIRSYNPAQAIKGALGDGSPECVWTLFFDPEAKSFSISNR